MNWSLSVRGCEAVAKVGPLFLPFSCDNGRPMCQGKCEGESERKEGPMSSVSRGEVEAVPTQRNFLFVEVSRRTGRGVCNAVSSMVERAHGARGHYPIIRRVKAGGIIRRRY